MLGVLSVCGKIVLAEQAYRATTNTVWRLRGQVKGECFCIIIRKLSSPSTWLLSHSVVLFSKYRDNSLERT